MKTVVITVEGGEGQGKTVFMNIIKDAIEKNKHKFANFVSISEGDEYIEAEEIIVNWKPQA